MTTTASTVTRRLRNALAPYVDHADDTTGYASLTGRITTTKSWMGAGRFISTVYVKRSSEVEAELDRLAVRWSREVGAYRVESRGELAACYRNEVQAEALVENDKRDERARYTANT